MYRILDESEEGIVGIRVEGKLSTEEYDLLNAYLEKLRQDVGPINFLCDMANFEGLDGEALWEEMTDHLRHVQEYQRIALVGNRRWLKGGPKVSVPWPKAQLKFFHTRPDRRGLALGKGVRSPKPLPIGSSWDAEDSAVNEFVAILDEQPFELKPLFLLS